MDINSGYAIGLLGLFGAFLVINQVSNFFRVLWPPILRFLIRHFVLPRLFLERHIFNPTRIEILLHSLHWIAVIVYNTWAVNNLRQAASRAAQLAVIHVVPLSLSHQLSFVSCALGLPLSAAIKMHQSLAVTTTVEAALHSLILTQIEGGWSGSMVFEIMCISSLLALLILPLMRRYGYEMFLLSHRSITIALFISLWMHVRSKQTLSRILLETAFGGFLASTGFQIGKQIHQNTAWNRQGVSLVHTLTARQCGDSLIVGIRLPRPWSIQAGGYIYLSLLTLKCFSAFQKHPFVVTWWDDEGKEEENVGNTSKALVLYIMIDPRHGWTKSVMARQTIFTDRLAWLSGPFGLSLRLEEYGTVILFASGNGIFAQLPLLKGLAEGLKRSAVKTRRVKLIWQTEAFHEQLQEWMHNILRDIYHNELQGRVHNVIRDDEDAKELLDICIHQPTSSRETAKMKHLERYGIHNMNRWVKIVYDVPDVKRYIEQELEGPRKRIAVTVSGHQQLRHDVRFEVLRARDYNVSFFELDYQPVQINKHRGGTAA